MSFFKRFETTASEIAKKQSVIFNTCISYRSFTNFSCVSSVLTFSVLFNPHLYKDQEKCYSIFVGRVMLILLGLERGIFVNHKVSAVVKNRFYYKSLTAVIFGANIHYF